MKSFLFIILLLCFISCKKGKSINWDNAGFDNTISNSPVYQELNTKKEILAVYEHDTAMRRTSDVIYTIEQDRGNAVNSSKYYNCRAYFFNPEILTINIGLSSGIRGEGFIINYSDGKFHLEPYSYIDPNSGKNKEVDYKVMEQTLTLNKQQYNIGDSLYGKINFYILKTDKGRPTEYCANGFFRTKISKQQ